MNIIQDYTDKGSCRHETKCWGEGRNKCPPPLPQYAGHLLFVIYFGVVLLQGRRAVLPVWLLTPGGAKAMVLTR